MTLNTNKDALREIASILESIAKQVREQADTKINPFQLIIHSQSLHINSLSFLRCATIEAERIKNVAKAN